MSLPQISIKNPVFAWMLMAGLIIFGSLSFMKMGISQMPDVDFPVVSISLSYEGAAPEVMEADVVDVIEDAVMSVQGIQNVTSKSRYASASVTLEFTLDRNIDAALQEVQTKVAQAQRQLPRELDPPVITKTNPEDQPIMWLTLWSESLSSRDLMLYVRDQLKDKFTTIDGVGEVMLAGYIEPNLRVWVSNRELNRYELTVGDLLDTISSEHAELPAGEVETSRKQYDIRTMGEAKNLTEFGALKVGQRGGRPNFTPIPLIKISKIEEGLAEIRRFSRFNGKPAIGLGIKKQRGTNAVQVAKNVRSRLTELQSNLPKDVQLSINFDTTTFIEKAVEELNFTLILSAILTAIVCWIFLRTLSSTMNVVLAIPTSIIGAFTILYFCGFTLNTFTLMGLSLAVGIVVDDAIMVLENIVRHREMGKTRIQAALDGAAEIMSAATASTIAIAAIFIPVAFMQGVIGKFFLQFGVTLTVTVFLSLLEAITLTPMRCSQFLAASKDSRDRMDRLLESSRLRYERILGWTLSHRWLTIALAVLFFAVSVSTGRLLKKEFVPAQDQGRFIIRVQAPVDSSIQFTDSKFKEVESFLAARPEVERYYAAVGGFGGGETSSGVIFVTMKDKGQRGKDEKSGRELSQQDFMDLCRKELKDVPDLKVFFQDLSLRGFSASRGFPIEFSIQGPEWDQLAELSEKMKTELQKSDQMSDIDSDYQLGKPEIRIYPDREKASSRGVSVKVISEVIRAMVGGIVTGKYAMGGHRYDIRVRMNPDESHQEDLLKDIWVRNNRGELVRLSEVVKLEEKSSLQQISRYNRQRAVSMFANLKTGASQKNALIEVKEIGDRILPKNYRLVLSGSAQSFDESQAGLMFALLLGILVSYMVLAAQFNSFLDPLTVLMALPFSISGAFLAMLALHQSLNVYSFIGLILLTGIVKKNSIMLVEFTNQIRERGEISVKAALMKACPIRLRPILMTSVATIAAAVPPALAWGPGSETRIPMAVAVMGGVIVSTILTLVVVPCVYSLLTGLDRSGRFDEVRDRAA